MFNFTSKIIFLSLVLFLFGLNFLVLPVQAKTQDYQLSTLAGVTGYKTSSNVESITRTVLKVTLSLMGILFFSFALYGGVRWMTAQGNEDHVTTAKNTLEAAAIGLVVVSLSYAITNLVFSKLGSGFSATSTSTAESGPLNLANGDKCQSSDDCADGICSLSGVCVTPCTDDADCTNSPDGKICNANQQCGPFMEGKSASGGPCADNANCSDGLFCIQNICKAGGGLGDDCDPPSCANGLVCSADKKCSSASSLAMKEGDSCAAVSCAGGLKCSEGKICLTVVGKGGDCLQSAAGYPVICQDGLVCGVEAKCSDPAYDPEAKCLADGGLWQNSKCTSASKINSCINSKVECESSCSQTKDSCETQCESVSAQCKVNNCDNPYQDCQQQCTPAVCMEKKKCASLTGNAKISCESECKVNYPNYCSTGCSSIKQTCYDNCNTQTACKNSCVSDFNFCSNQAQCEKKYQQCLGA